MKKSLDVQQTERIAASAAALLRQGDAPTKDKVLLKRVEDANPDLHEYYLYKGIKHAQSKGTIVWKTNAPKGWILPDSESASEPIETDVNNSNTEAKIPSDSKKPIRALGLYWDRSKVNWAPVRVTLRAVQKEGAPVVNFSDQKGIYILYDGRDVVYVGRTVNTLGNRLRDHTRDELKTRWTRFSGFGFLSLDEDGNLKHRDVSVSGWSELAALLEAVLITSLEPPLNWRSGDHLKGKEFIQVEDPDLVIIRSLEEHMRRLLDLKGSK